MPKFGGNFRRDWFVANALAWPLAYVLYTPIAHGVTGGHAHELTPAQMVAHSLALAVVAAIVAMAQRAVVAGYVHVPWARVAIAAIAFIAAFWIGYYQPVVIGPDTDYLLGYLALGSAVWLGIVPASGHRVAAAIAILSFPIAGVIGEMLVIAAVVAMNITPELQTNDFQHALYWITVGGTAGVLGGWLSGLALARMLPRSPAHAAG